MNVTILFCCLIFFCFSLSFLPCSFFVFLSFLLFGAGLYKNWVVFAGVDFLGWTSFSQDTTLISLDFCITWFKAAFG